MSFTAAVVICTYNRNDPLRRALLSVCGQILGGGRTAEVVVVDNTPGRIAEGLVAEVAAAPGGLPVRYLSAPVPNVSLARNAGIAGTEAPFVVFLDDDEWCGDADWLDALLRVAAATGADAVFGAVLPVFPDGPPAWDPTGRAYTRDAGYKDGAPLPLAHDQAASGRWIGTGNSLLRRDTCLTDAAPFDPRLGIVGGEDNDLFHRLAAAGCRFAWCAGAAVQEEVPGPRTRFRYFLRWSFRSGQHWAGTAVRRSARPGATAAWLGLRAAAQLVLVGAGWAASRLAGRPSAPARALKLAETAGKLAWWALPLATPR